MATFYMVLEHETPTALFVYPEDANEWAEGNPNRVVVERELPTETFMFEEQG